MNLSFLWKGAVPLASDASEFSISWFTSSKPRRRIGKGWWSIIHALIQRHQMVSHWVWNGFRGLFDFQNKTSRTISWNFCQKYSSCFRSKFPLNVIPFFYLLEQSFVFFDLIFLFFCFNILLKSFLYRPDHVFNKYWHCIQICCFKMKI